MQSLTFCVFLITRFFFFISIRTISGISKHPSLCNRDHVTWQPLQLFSRTFTRKYFVMHGSSQIFWEMIWPSVSEIIEDPSYFILTRLFINNLCKSASLRSKFIQGGCKEAEKRDIWFGIWSIPFNLADGSNHSIVWWTPCLMNHLSSSSFLFLCSSVMTSLSLPLFSFSFYKHLWPGTPFVFLHLAYLYYSLRPLFIFLSSFFFKPYLRFAGFRCAQLYAILSFSGSHIWACRILTVSFCFETVSWKYFWDLFNFFSDFFIISDFYGWSHFYAAMHFWIPRFCWSSLPSIQALPLSHLIP